MNERIADKVVVTKGVTKPCDLSACGSVARGLAKAEVWLPPSSLKAILVHPTFEEAGQFILFEGERPCAQVGRATTGLPLTPVFQSRYATNEVDCRTVRLSTGALDRGPQTTDRGPLTSVLRPPNSQLPASSSEVQPSSFPGNRLDGTGGWKPLELGEIVERWKELTGKHAAFAKQLNH